MNNLKKLKENKMKIYLDDVRTPKDKDWMVVRNYHEFVNFDNPAQQSAVNDRDFFVIHLIHVVFVR